MLISTPINYISLSSDMDLSHVNVFQLSILADNTHFQETFEID